MSYRSEYGPRNGDAQIVVVADGEYVRAERDDNAVGVLWSSDKDVLPTLRLARTILGDLVSGEESVFVQFDLTDGNGDTGTGSGDDVEEYLSSTANPPVAFLSAEFKTGHKLLWGAPASRVEGSTSVTFEVGCRYPRVIGHALVDALMEQTSTSHLASKRAEVTARLTQLQE